MNYQHEKKTRLRNFTGTWKHNKLFNSVKRTVKNKTLEKDIYLKE